MAPKGWQATRRESANVTIQNSPELIEYNLHDLYTSPLFLTLFPMVSTPLPADDGNPWKTFVIRQNHENDEKMMFSKLIKDHSGDV